MSGRGGRCGRRVVPVGYVAMRHPFRATFALAAVVLSSGTAAARWGDHGHRLAAAAAAGALPREMPAFFLDAADQLAWLDPDPDRWRDLDETRADPALNGANAPDHFVDFEWTTPGSLRAPNRYAFLDSLRAAGQTQLPGFLPFRIVELTQRLRTQFRAWRAMPEGPERRFLEQRIVNDAGILGHYVTDGANPHHTTIHHNGWRGANPDGFATDVRTHARFESIFVQARITAPDVTRRMSAPARAFPDVRDAVLAYLRETHAELRPLYLLDTREAFGAETQGQEHRDFAATRLAAGATMLRDLWWTAWATSERAAAPPRR